MSISVMKQWFEWRRAVLAVAITTGIASCTGGLDSGLEEPVLGEDDGMPADDPRDGTAPGHDIPPPDAEEDPGYVPGQLLVRFKSGTGDALALAAHEENQARVLRSYRVPSNLHLVELPESVSIEEAIEQYREEPGVLYVQPNFRYRINERFPNDLSLWDWRWGLHAYATYQRVDPDIDAPEAWDITTGSHDVVIGVIDTGTAPDDPDLHDNMFINPGEIPDNGEDDDGNGFVDDVHGINAIYPGGDLQTMDGHGWYVNTIIGAQGNNDHGTAGVMWNVQIATCKAFDYGGYGLDSEILACMDYFLELKTRTENPVDIIATNNSWSSFIPPYWTPQHQAFSQALLEAIEAHDRAGILFVAAAGNDGLDCDSNPCYPAGYEVDNVIAVAATTESGFIDQRSNLGRRSVDVVAPGEFSSGAETAKGTSASAAYVTGVIGLLKAHDPSLSPAQIKNLVLTGGDEDLPYEGYDGDYEVLSGRRINAYHSLTCHDRVLVQRSMPATDQVSISLGESLQLGVLSIDCAEPHPGSYFATVAETGEVIRFVDERNNGHFKGVFQSYEPGSFQIHFSTGDSIIVDVVINYDRPRVVEFEYRDIQSIGIPLDLSDFFAQIPAPFSLPFGSAPPGVQDIFVSLGALSFSQPPLYPHAPLPDPTQEILIAPFWMYMELADDSTVSYAVLGEPPDRELIIDWNNMVFYNDVSSISFQVVLFENSRKILFSYEDVTSDFPWFDEGIGAIVGIQLSPTIARTFSYLWASLRNEMTLLWSIGTPIALAGAGQLVAPGDEVVLDGGNSREVVGAITSYTWTQTAGTPVLIEDAYQAMARFVAPHGAGTLSFELAVTDEDDDTGTDTLDVIVNPRPVADAGDDFALANLLRGTLDGSGSVDVEGAIVGYTWRQLSGEPVALSSAQTAIASFTAPATPQILVFELTVQDEYGFTGTDRVTVDIFQNDPPVAEAGEDLVVKPGSVVSLDGSASRDPDGAILRYAWETTLCMTAEGPCVVNLIDADTARPVFEVPASNSVIHFRLTVTDDAGATSSDTLLLGAFLQEPRAVIEPLASCATSGSTFWLDGRESWDDDGAIAYYHWEQLAGTPVAIGTPSNPAIEFTVPSTQEGLTFALTVTDDNELSDTAAITIPVSPPAMAVATVSALAARTGQTVTLSGSQSQNAATYIWVQTSGTPVALSNADAAVASFVVPRPVVPLETATFALTVDNGCGTTAIDTVSIIFVRS